MKKFKKSLSLILALVLIVGAMFILNACGNENATDGNAQEISTSASQTAAASSGSTAVGEGETNFVFTVIDTEGKETIFDVYTDKTTVGEALLDCGLIQGENGDYGLYVKTVNGTTLDYNIHGKYWAFYVDGELSMTGVDMTDITPGSAYCFKAE